MFENTSEVAGHSLSILAYPAAATTQHIPMQLTIVVTLVKARSNGKLSSLPASSRRRTSKPTSTAVIDTKTAVFQALLLCVHCTIARLACLYSPLPIDATWGVRGSPSAPCTQPCCARLCSIATSKGLLYRCNYLAAPRSQVRSSEAGPRVRSSEATHRIDRSD